MFNNDYIMRMIEQLVWGIAKIMHLKQENRQEEATDLVTDTLRKFFGLNDRTVEELPWENLMSIVSLGGAPDPERCALLAQLIKEKADLTNMQGKQAESAGLYCKALNMLLTAVLADDMLASGTNTQYIEDILARASGWELPEDSKPLLFQYYEFAGRYGKAEDMLYEILKAANQEDAIEKGEAFYRRLMLLPDAELLQGGLPRDEVMEGYRKITGMK